jgi:polysaccharide deacetylase family protein (PEP-CTERM system associated)
MIRTTFHEGGSGVLPVETTADFAGWAARPVAGIRATGANALTVDVEDYFQVEAFSGVIDRESWSNRECRVEQNVDRILEMFSDGGVHATFFTLGWIAERYPSVVRRIVDAGHELASHGVAHHRADSQGYDEFLDDVARAKHTLEDIGGVSVNGYRAASFSINKANLWAFDALDRAGYRYSSSLYPTRYIPEAPQFAFHPAPGSSFMEIPVTSVRRFGVNLPCGGGGFFRLLPYWLSAQSIRRVANEKKQPCIFYFHPWEIDPGQPRIADAPLKARIRHYTNLTKMQARLKQLLTDFSWRRLDHIYPIAAS